MLLLSLSKILHLFILFTTLFLSVLSQSNPASCLTDTECGANSNCTNNICKCNNGYITYLLNATECHVKIDTSCGQVYCKTCHPGGEQMCVRCISRYYFESTSSLCVSNCASGFQLEHKSFDVNGSTVGVSRLACNPRTNSSDSSWAFGLLTAILLIILFGVIIAIVVLIFTRFGRMFLFSKHKTFQLSRTIASNKNAEVQDVKPTRPKPRKPIQNSTKPTDIEMNVRNHSINANTNEESVIHSEPATSSPSKDAVSIISGEISAINPIFERESIDPTKMKELFDEKLAFLRSKSLIFLQMLNDMRRRLKELPNDHPTVTQYRSVMRDVTRLLYLLNKKPENVDIPPDGLKLLDWAHRILDRYELAQSQSRKEAEAATSNNSVPVTPIKTIETPVRVSMVLGDQDETKF